MYHKYHRFIFVEVNCLQKCSSVVAGHRTWPACVCVCVCVCSCVCICWGTSGPQTGKGQQLAGWGCQAHFCCRTPAAPPCGHLFRCLGLYLPRPIIWGIALYSMLCWVPRQVQAPGPISSSQPKLGQKPPHTIPSISPEDATIFSEMWAKLCSPQPTTGVKKEMSRTEEIYGVGKERNL